MKHLLVLLSIYTFSIGLAQSRVSQDTLELYKDYREDQFYLSITYNVLNNTTDEITQVGFSPGFHFGFIRDMPMNRRRNVAFGLGLGLSINSYNQNLSIFENEDGLNFEVFNEQERNVTRNRFSTYLIELPIEFRWRTSTPTEYNFWRIYAGVKLGYMFYNTTTLKSDQGDQNLSNIDVFNRFQYGITLSAGLSTWNIYVYYGLNTLFNDDAKLDAKTIDLSTLNIGLIFFIL